MAYINRELALKLLERNSITKHITFSDSVSIYDTIANIPAADVAPKSEVAREIFAEIEKYLTPEHLGFFTYRYFSKVLAILKKKYVGDICK